MVRFVEEGARVGVMERVAARVQPRQRTGTAQPAAWDGRCLLAVRIGSSAALRPLVT